jgi:hypothetical protein
MAFTLQPARRGEHAWLAPLALALAFLFAGTSAFAQAPSFTRSYPGGAIVVVEVATEGDITVQASLTSSVEIVGRLASKLALVEPDLPSAAVASVLAEPPLVVTGDTLRLESPADAAAREDVTISYDVRVPARTAVVIRTGSGRVAVRGLSGDVAVRTVSGPVRVERTSGTIEVDTASGAVHAANVDGPLRVSSLTGDVTVRGAAGPFFARTHGGRVHAALDTAGDVDIETRSAPISVRGARGRLIASSLSGAIEVAGRPDDEWSIRSETGHIEARLGPGSNARIDAMTSSGTIRMEVPDFQGAIGERLVSGTLGLDGIPVRLVSGTGVIRMALAR